jgi:hypothetical protein
MSAPREIRTRRDRIRSFFEHQRYSFKIHIHTETIFGTPLFNVAMGSFTITDYDEARRWLDLRKEDRRGELFINTLYKSIVEPIFWKVYREKNCFQVLQSIVREIDFSPYGMFAELYRLTEEGDVQWYPYHELSDEIQAQASVYRGCKLNTALSTCRTRDEMGAGWLVFRRPGPRR